MTYEPDPCDALRDRMLVNADGEFDGDIHHRPSGHSSTGERITMLKRIINRIVAAFKRATAPPAELERASKPVMQEAFHQGLIWPEGKRWMARVMHRDGGRDTLHGPFASKETATAFLRDSGATVSEALWGHHGGSRLMGKRAIAPTLASVSS